MVRYFLYIDNFYSFSVDGLFISNIAFQQNIIRVLDYGLLKQTTVNNAKTAININGLNVMTEVTLKMTQSAGGSIFGFKSQIENNCTISNSHFNNITMYQQMYNGKDMAAIVVY